MTPALLLALTAVFSYLAGSIPFGLLLARAAGFGDIRKLGSGNIGATNVLRTGSKKLAAATLLLDAGKGAAMVLLFRFTAGEDAALLAGLAALIGHMFPVWLGFKGGKGVATALGTLLAAAPVVGLGACAVWLLAALAFRYSSLAALLAVASAPLFTYSLYDRPELTGLAAIILLLVNLRHRANIARLVAGTEPRIGQKSTAATAEKADG